MVWVAMLFSMMYSIPGLITYHQYTSLAAPSHMQPEGLRFVGPGQIVQARAGKLTGRPLASLTFLKRSPFGATSMASATWVCVRNTSRNLMMFGWLNLQESRAYEGLVARARPHQRLSGSAGTCCAQHQADSFRLLLQPVSGAHLEWW